MSAAPFWRAVLDFFLPAKCSLCGLSSDSSIPDHPCATCLAQDVTVDQVRRAHAAHPIAAVQFEYSLWRREAEADLLPTLRELGIALVAWSPLGAGFLTGTVDALDSSDFRRNNPRFSGDTLAANRDRFAPLLAVARQLEVTPAQLALAWLLHRGPEVIPIPGTRRPERVDENAGAAGIQLDDGLLRRIDAIARPGLAQGATLL